MLWSTPSRLFLAAVTLLSSTMPGLARATDAGPTPATTSTPCSIVIGFVGGFVAHNNLRHGPVKLAKRIQGELPPGSYVRVFENRHRRLAYNDILRLLDTDHDGALSVAEKARAHIVLFGHSWGAAAAVALARDLRKEGVSVLLTVQVDSVAKAWQNDAVIPDNVAEAINFYQPHGILHGRQQITAANPEKTQVLGNYREDYQKNPIECRDATWFGRVFTSGHMQSECDPHVWSQIEGMMLQRLAVSDASPSASTVVPVAMQRQQ